MRRAWIASLALALVAGCASSQHSTPMPPETGVATQPALVAKPAPADNTRAELRALLASRRAANLAAFHAYRLGGSFPRNRVLSGELNVWRDERGKLCAAATMIAASGEVALVETVAHDDNYVRLADIHDGPLLDWMLTSGLTQDEVALIQRPFVGKRQLADPMEGPDVVDPIENWAAEDARLAKLYEAIEERLAADTELSLDRAVELLVASPELAARLRA
jgi:hypothetical protein